MRAYGFLGLVDIAANDGGENIAMLRDQMVYRRHVRQAQDAEPIELHHDKVEFALANGVDVARFAVLYPELGVVDDETFACFVESDGNLTPLCRLHHTGIRGVHVLPYPVWVIQRVWRKDLPAPGELARSGDAAP